MSDKTNYLETAVIDYFLRPGAAAPTRPTSVTVGLLTAITDAEAGTVTEAAYSGYARQNAGFSAANPSLNAGVIDFPAVAGAGISVVGYAIYDHLDNELIVKAITPVAFNVGDIPRINAGALSHAES